MRGVPSFYTYRVSWLSVLQNTRMVAGAIYMIQSARPADDYRFVLIASAEIIYEFFKVHQFEISTCFVPHPLFMIGKVDKLAAAEPSYSVTLADIVLFDIS